MGGCKRLKMTNEIAVVTDVGCEYVFPLYITRESVNRKKVIRDGVESHVMERNVRIMNGDLYFLMRSLLYRGLHYDRSNLKSQRRKLNSGMMMISSIGINNYPAFLLQLKAMIKVLPERFYSIKPFELRVQHYTKDVEQGFYYELYLRDTALAYLKQKEKDGRKLSDIYKIVLTTIESISQPSDPISFDEWVDDMTRKCMRIIGGSEE